MIQNPFFPEIHGNFGFGCMRLPMKDGKVNYDEFCRMADAFIASGLNYFDTAHGYIGGQSETAIRDCVAKRHARSEFLLTDKLTTPYFNKEEDIRPFFESQLKACGVEYFDFYLMHAQNAKNFQKYKACRAYETAFELKKEGKIRHVGISFHDTAEALDQILTEYPEIEAVQIQFNYVDYEDAVVQSRRVYETAVKHGKPVIVMEPVKGGKLVELPEEAQKIFDSLQGGSNASYAIRFAAGFENMMMVLSGMSTIEQLNENVSYMADFQPLSDTERAAVEQVQHIFRSQGLIPCTACRYCVDGCPMQIPIPDLFSVANAKKQFPKSDHAGAYAFRTNGKGKASDCIKCGACERICPQKLPVRKLLEEVAESFE